ncbi:hypothetical protein [Burkholderia ambifaria]|uniref:hypothetical protein n=1 Tax=Burkholderia ambifaria TaxID=152480 RepID=UPI001D11A7AC|nr:hypothetical protein [Burkholderia ambifaria]UZU01897.1 hypothetical protein OR987_14405 [Burkholderia ambifaria]UZU08449.1 hypothetical protein OR988_14405 [Burkholderia ambifaria]WDS13306.1 hypothetical protein OR984_07855 [Burkholderia ambifaria]WDS26443.1 hypothetical protein OR983_07875 [Burkholderia ambifaria]
MSRFSGRTLIFLAEAGSALAVSSRAAELFFIALFQGMYRVSMMSDVPEMVGHEGQHRFNAILGATDGVSVVGGSLLASMITKTIFPLISMPKDFFFEVTTMVFFSEIVGSRKRCPQSQYVVLTKK